MSGVSEDHGTGDDSGLVEVGPVEEVREESPTTVPVDGTAVAVFYHEDEFHAVDNRCPHMGFPLEEGTVEEGILTCHWHHARFELSCGDTFDPWADDVPNYPVEVRDDTVYVLTAPERDLPPDERWRRRLDTGMEENLRLVIAKSVIGLESAGVEYVRPIEGALEFGTHYREDGWSSGLTILAAMANVLEDVRPEDRRRALYTGIRHTASDCAGEPPRFDQPALDTEEVSPDRLEEWFRENVEVRDADGAERVLRTAVRNCDRETVEGMVFSAATDHVYMNTGHTLDFCNKAVEVLDHVGWDEHAEDTLASLVTSLTEATRSEELSQWRQPVDVAGLLFDAYEDLDRLVADGDGRDWSPPERFHETLLGDDPEAIVDALTTAVGNGATTTELADRVCHAAATRVAQFGTANEFSDWNTVHHTFTYANAVRQATRRTDVTELYRGVFDAAMNVYLDRFLNTPPAPIPEPSETDRDPGTVLEDVLDTFDEEGEVNAAGRLVGEFFDADGDPGDLKQTLGRGLLREDAGFHTLQALEAGFRQYDLADTDHERRVAMAAVARYLSAHFPTRREAEQTFTIAERLDRGESIHE
jgi:nitrite reductase/ring-hydroxylating ferredoxin subunit